MIHQTEHLANNSEPAQSLRALLALLDHPTHAVAAVRAGSIRRANPTWQRLFSARTDDPREQSVLSIFVGVKSAERFERLLLEALQKGVARVEHLLSASDGSSFMAEIIVQRLGEDNSLGADSIWQVRDITAERDLRRELVEVEQFYRALSMHQPDPLLVIDRRLTISFASPSIESLLGLSANILLGRPWRTFLHPEDVERTEQVLTRMIGAAQSRHEQAHICRMRHRDGSERVLSTRMRNCIDLARIDGIVICARDITGESLDQQQREQQADYASRLRDALFALATDAAADLASQLDRITRVAVEELGVQSASFWRYDAERSLFRCEQRSLRAGQAMVADPMRELISDADFPLYVQDIHLHRPIIVPDIHHHPAVGEHHVARLAAANIGAMLDFPVVRSHKTLGVLSLEYAAQARSWASEEIDFAAGLSLLVALALESEERRVAAAHTEVMALHDSLTGLANRNHAESELRAALAQAAKSAGRVSLLLIDLDEFKEVNDTLGHGHGDRLLVRVASLLREATGPEALVARMGGDEFLVILRDMGAEQVGVLAQSIVDRLGASGLVPGMERHIGASVGVASFPDDAQEAEALLAQADIAMYQAKGAGRSQFYVFNAQLAQRLALQRELDSEIGQALKSGELSLFYQPQIELKSGNVIGLEALLRWQHPQRGLLLPSTFMAAAEHSGSLDAITKWALGEACDQIVGWERAGFGLLPISVNVTARQFQDRHLPATIASALMRSGVAARNLVLEVTEQSLLDSNKTTERVLTELRELGVRIAIDDFGAGYSSLSYLRRLVVSQIKLDKAFIDDLATEGDSATIIAAVIAIARRLDYMVVAEGIETREQYDQLVAAGCDAGQGFYFGAPLSAAEIAEFLEARATRS